MITRDYLNWVFDAIKVGSGENAVMKIYISY